ncbi:TQO small subunit DoxD [Dermatophilaceae bacterium Sec6.4]|nr:DoxX family membrane protein [Actinomycetota bacterium]
MTHLKAGATTAGNGTPERRARNVVRNGPVGAVVALVALRILTSWPWVNGAFFGADSKVGSYFLSGAFLKARISGPTGFAAHSLYPRIGHFVATTIYDNASFWAWIIFLGEAAAGISLLLGLLTRIGGLVAALSALANLLAAAGGGADSIGQNYLLLILGVLFIITAPGRRFGLDGLLLRHYPNLRWLRLVM